MAENFDKLHLARILHGGFLVDGNRKGPAMRLENIAWTCLACALVGACLVLVVIA